MKAKVPLTGKMAVLVTSGKQRCQEPINSVSLETVPDTVLSSTIEGPQVAANIQRWAKNTSANLKDTQNLAAQAAATQWSIVASLSAGGEIVVSANDVYEGYQNGDNQQMVMGGLGGLGGAGRAYHSLETAHDAAEMAARAQKNAAQNVQRILPNAAANAVPATSNGHVILAERRLLSKGEELVASSKPSMRERLGQRHVYVNQGHHDPVGGLAPYNPQKTVLPKNHVELFNKAIPHRNPNNGKVTYYAIDDQNNFHRFQSDSNGTEFHWNGQTNGTTKAGYATDDIPVPHDIKKQLK